MNGKMRVAKRFVNLLILFVCRFAGNSVNGELLPESVPFSLTTSINPLMPNNEQSVKDCPYTNFPYAKRGLTSSIFAERYRDKTFSHVVKLDTVEESNCVGVIVDQLHILTTKECAQKQPQTISFQNVTQPRWGILNTKYHIGLDVALLQLRSNLR
ncbi:AAEL005807-PA [Aedes aegypti]|uniref:AAEL005807-PA n=1 Tax=Aedes aegypti TaxID=7159 RepID=Q178P8_AEDAE|nr:AAEL005807-PA [Aedes aegypti]